MTQKTELTRDGFDRLGRTSRREHARLENARRVVREQMEVGGQEKRGLEAVQRDVMAIQTTEDSPARALVSDPAELQDDRAALGVVLVVLDMDAGREPRLRLVSPARASALAGAWPRVSPESPVGRERLGRRVGETFAVKLGRGEVTYRVVNVTS